MFDTRPNETCGESTEDFARRRPAQRLLEVWLRWDDDIVALHRSAKPQAALEQFTMVRARPCEEDASVWRCSFVHAGRSLDMDRQAVSLLRRLTTIAPWTRAERSEVAPDQRASLSGARVIDELDWDLFGRRALP